ncbi:hypothetical protein OYC64_012651 [Pagothenia borchgrevinki]|uniref:Uncharacterized protein n=1 Tax=Pagothenia borchgrevinki TaxID=8213 RepID=A0ABD2G9M6_PAGBO
MFKPPHNEKLSVFLLQASETFPSFHKPLLWSWDPDTEAGKVGGASRGGLCADWLPKLSVTQKLLADWLREADPQVSSAHRGAGRREARLFEFVRLPPAG